MNIIYTLLKSLLRNIVIALFLVLIAYNIAPVALVLSGFSEIADTPAQMTAWLKALVGLVIPFYLYFMFKNNIEHYWPTIIFIIIFPGIITFLYRLFYITNFNLSRSDFDDVLFYWVIVSLVYLDYRFNFRSINVNSVNTKQKCPMVCQVEMSHFCKDGN